MNRPESGRADLVALAAALLLGGAALTPGLLLRDSEGWTLCRSASLLDAAAAPEPDPVAGPLAAAEGARSLVATSSFRPDPTRLAGPLPESAGQAAPGTVRDLAGRVADGRLYLRWRPAPGSSGTSLRVEGLGGPGPVNREVPASEGEVEIPVPGTAGTALVFALPTGLPGKILEARVSIPFRIPVEAVRATAGSVATESVLLVLLRAYDGRLVEGEFPLRVADPVAGFSTAGAGTGGAVVDFRTDLVVERVRTLPGVPVLVPTFAPDGRVARDGTGIPILVKGPPLEGPTLEVVLRGPDDRRQVLPVAGDRR